MVKSARTLLKEELKRSFLPILKQHGWSQRKRPDDWDSPELRRVDPFGAIMRSAADGEQMVDIQFDKRSRAKFRITIGTLPKEGLPSIINSTMIPAEGLFAQNASNAHVLRPSVFFSEWFGFWPWQKTDKVGARKLVSNLISKWDEAESFFLCGHKGRYLKKWPR